MVIFFSNILLLEKKCHSNIIIIIVGKLPSIYKNAEVRLVRLKSRLSKNKNKSPCNVQSEKIEKLSEKSVTTVDDLANQFNEDSFYEEMDWEPMQDEKITFEVMSLTLIRINIFFIQNYFFKHFL